MKKDERGAEFIEFSLTAIVFLIVFLGILELCRIMAVRALLIKGAEDGAMIASQIPDIDLIIPDDGTGHPDITSPLYERYYLARARVIDAAERTPGSTLLSSLGVCPPVAGWNCANRNAANGMQQLNLYAVNLPSGLGVGQQNVDAMLLRPDQFDTVNPTTYFEYDGTPRSTIYPPDFHADTDSTADLQRRFRRYPLVVEMRADVRPLTPFIPTIKLLARASAFREPAPDSSYGVLPQPPITNTTSTTTTTTTTTTVPTTTTTTVSTSTTASTTTTTTTTLSTTSTTDTTTTTASTSTSSTDTTTTTTTTTSTTGSSTSTTTSTLQTTTTTSGPTTTTTAPSTTTTTTVSTTTTTTASTTTTTTAPTTTTTTTTSSTTTTTLCPPGHDNPWDIDPDQCDAHCGYGGNTSFSLCACDCGGH